MDGTTGIERIFDNLGLNTVRIIAFPYLIFLILCILYWIGIVPFIKSTFIYFSSSSVAHIFGGVSLATVVISFRKRKNRSEFLFYVKQIFRKEPDDEKRTNLVQSNLTEKEFVQSLMIWTENAHQVCIYGGSANFLNDNNIDNNREFIELKKLGKKCKLLITRNFTGNIEKLWELSNYGVQIRTYPEGDLNIRGRLKRSTTGVES